MKKALLFILLLPFALPLYADHIIGTDLTYKKIDSNHYRVRFVLYRDCNACRMNQDTSLSCGTADNCSTSSSYPSWLMVRGASGSCNGTLLDSISLSRTSIASVSGTCRTERDRCTKPCGSTFPYGVEEHVFTGDLDVTSMRNSGCCLLNLSISMHGRSAAITTGQAGTSFYTDAEMYICGDGNNSPIYFNYPLFFACCGQAVQFATGSLDSLDFDSISFRLAVPRTSASTFAPFASGLDSSSPVPTYHPSSCVTRTINAIPPIGFNFDSVAGKIIFTPATSSCSPVSCPFVGLISLESREWRRINGVMTMVGRITREMQLTTMNCSNSSPHMDASHHVSICEEAEYASVIQSYDALSDSTKMRWSGGIPGAHFRITGNPGDLREKVYFYWIPAAGTARTSPYVFYLEAADNVCPVNARYSEQFLVTVKPTARASIQKELLPCSRLRLAAVNQESTSTYYWEIRDSINNSAGKQLVDTNRSSSASDTFTFRKAGRYIIKMTVNNGGNCSSYKYDTVIIQHNSINLSDSIRCRLQPIELTAQIEDSNYTKLRWQGSETDSFQTFVFNGDSSQWVHAELITNNCIYEDSAFIRVPESIRLGTDTLICKGDTVELLPVNDGPLFTSYYWSALDTFINLDVFNPGTYVLTASDTNDCLSTDSIHVSHLPHALNLPDTVTFCKSSTVQIGQKNGLKNWSWLSGDTTPFITISLPGIYILHARDSSNNCGLYDTVAAAYNSHALDLPDTARFCKGSSVLIGQKNGLKNWSWLSGDTTPFISVSIPGAYILQARDSLNDCEQNDTVMVVPDSVPPFDFNINLTGTNTYRFSATLDGTSFEWDFGDGSDTLDADTVISHSYSVPGTYKICLRLSFFNYCSDTLCKWVSTLSTGKSLPEQSVLLYPNPFNEKFSLDFYAAEPGYLTLTAFDMLGRQHKLVSTQHLQTGKSSFLIDANEAGLPQGILLLKLSFNGGERWIKMLRLSE